MREAVIVAARRTPIGKAYRGAFNNTYGATLGAHALSAVVDHGNWNRHGRIRRRKIERH